MSEDESKLTKTIERLEGMLEERDEKIEALEERLRGSQAAWSMPYDVPDEHAALPLPRLEIVWRPSEDYGWRHYVAEYRLVHAHLLGHLVATPLGETKVSGGNGKPPWESEGRGAHYLPYRDGAHAHHDAAHLGLPLYAMLPTGPRRLDGPESGYDHQRERGMGQRRGQGGR